MDCIAKLSEKQRDLIRHAYEGETTIRQLAEQLHRSPQTIYNRLNLIRHELFECVEDAVRQQGTKQ
ncbi:MAG: HTH domain-containing protein [Pirellulales bacterium]|nr:HTH domain-containing protein [Pirellulales bacterium]